MIQKTIDALTSFLAIIPKNDKCWQRQASIIIAFAIKMSEDLLKSTGFTDPESEKWKANMLAVPVKNLDIRHAPAGLLGILLLKNVPATLTAETEMRVPANKTLYFCTGRVLDWDEDHHAAKAVITYEDAARTVVFWLMAKMLCICQANQWDRVSGLPRMIDQMAEMIIHPSVQDIILNESVLAIEFSSKNLASRFQYAMKISEVETVRDLLKRFKSSGQLRHTKNIGQKVCEDVNKWLESQNLHFGMKV
ncbi:MAG: hypothetical protein HY918_05885 [Candidatus Doudnabacteria bacterium]|nr:hypothetical protein [Candidatus Doudnabacteria bacterium]